MRVLLFCLLFVRFLYANNEEFTLDREAEPSAYIYGCVNAITGTLLQADRDIEIKAPTPLTLTRFYNNKISRISSGGYFGYGHSLDHPLVISEIDYGKDMRVMVEEVGGSFLRFYSSKEQPNTFYLDPEMPKFGLSNGGGSNYKQIKMVAIKNGKETTCPWQMQLPDGTKRFYENSHLVRQELPNGTHFHYGYDGYYRPTRITCRDRTGELEYGWINFQYIEDTKYTDVIVTSSDGQKVVYKMIKALTRFDNPNKSKDNPFDYYSYTFPLLDHAQGSSFGDIRYTYFKPGMNTCSHDMRRIDKPNGRFLEFQFRGGRATQISGPYGKLFDIHYDKHKTVVKDAEGGQVWYGSTPEMWIDRVLYWESGKNYRSHACFWNAHEKYVKKGRQPTDQNGYLAFKALLDSEANIVRGTHYSYDERGNVTKETLCGNLSGMLIPNISLDAQNRPQGTFESYSIKKTFSKDGFNLPTVIEEDNGLRTEISYLPGTNLITAKVNQFVKELFEYDRYGLLIKKTSDDGIARRITKFTPLYTHPGMGQPGMIEEYYEENGDEVLLKRSRISYDSRSRPTRVEIFDANGQFCYTTEQRFDDHDNILYQRDPAGRETRFEYDANNNKTLEELLGSQHQTFFHYDLCNRLICKEDHFPDNTFTTTFEYDKLGRKRSETDPFGQTVRTFYDTFGRPIEVRFPDCCEKKEYTIADEVSAFTDREGNRTRITYNAYGKPTRILYPDGSEERFEYTKKGELAQKWDKSGLCISYTYDPLGHVVEERCDHYSQTFEYIGDHLLLQIDKMGNCTEYTYDGAGRKTSEIKCGRQTTLFAYDALGRLAKTTKDDVVQIQEYDFLDRVVEERTEDTCANPYAKTCFIYDIFGNKATTIQYQAADLPCTTTKLYNARSECIQTTDALSQTTAQTYDHFYINPQGQKVLKKVTIDPLGNSIIEIFDIYKRVVSKDTLSPSGELLAHTSFTYDHRGKETSQIHLNGFAIHSQYDAIGRLILQDEMGKITQNTYDKAGRLSIITKPDGVKLHHTYDALGRLQSLCSSDNSIDYFYTYDLNNNLLLVHDHQSPSSVYTYDDLGHLTKECLANGLTLQFEYDPFSRLKTLTLPDQSTITYFYMGPDLHHITRTKNTLTYTHTYAKRNWFGSPTHETLINNTFLTHTYDLLNRPLTLYSTHFSEEITRYDQAGNLLSLHFTDPIGQETCNYTYDALYQLSSEPEHTYTHDSLHNRTSKDSTPISITPQNRIATFTYDANGNLLNDGLNTYHYDALNRLIQANSTFYTYDSSGRRMTKNSTPFLYLNKCEIGTPTHLRILGTGRAADVKATIAIETPEGLFTPIHDHRGNITLLLSLSNTPIQTLRYTAFGETTTYGPDITPWQFSSKRIDPETGLYLFTNRYYDPRLGRFLTPDPLGYTDGPNLYAFVHNSPLILFDPYGLFLLGTYFNVPQNENCKPNVSFINFENFFSQKSSICKTTGLKDHPNLGFGFINGINNTKADFNKSMKYLSEMSGYNFTGVYNATHGIVADVIESKLGLEYKASEPTLRLHNLWDAHFDSHGPNAQYLMFTHSQGNIFCRNGLLTYDPERAKRIHVRAFAPAAYTDSTTCGSVRHYRAKDIWRDFVPRIDFQGAQMAKQAGCLTELEATPECGPWVHSLDNPIYRKSMKDEMNQFIKNFGGAVE